MHRLQSLIAFSLTVSAAWMPSFDAPPDGPVVIVGADEHEISLVIAAVERFGAVGLELPPVEVVVHRDPEACRGHDGYWTPREPRDRIDLCVVDEFLVLHELAHAWDHHVATDEVRAAFMNLHPEVEWHQGGEHRRQGVERFADAVAWGLLSTPIANVDSATRQEAIDRRVAAFELVTGVATPRILQAT